MTENDPTSPRPARGIYLLPNLITTGGMFAGFYAIIAASVGNYVDACIAVFVAGVLDGLDGRIARLTNTQTEFGVQYDSLADLVSFGMAPALVMYHWSLASFKILSPFWGKVGWTAAFLYAACTALRLARFNTQVGVVDKRYFVGLASPAAAALMMSSVWIMIEWEVGGVAARPIALVVTIAAALLMVSRFRYYSFKTLPWADRVPFMSVLLALGFFVALTINPPNLLFAIAATYASSAPLVWLFGRIRRSTVTPSA